jgi:hypothetical protein
MAATWHAPRGVGTESMILHAELDSESCFSAAVALFIFQQLASE